MKILATLITAVLLLTTAPVSAQLPDSTLMAPTFKPAAPPPPAVDIKFSMIVNLIGYYAYFENASSLIAFMKTMGWGGSMFVCDSSPAIRWMCPSCSPPINSWGYPPDMLAGMGYYVPFSDFAAALGVYDPGMYGVPCASNPREVKLY